MDHLEPYAPPPFPVPEEQRIKFFDWMVLTCYPEELKKQLHLKELKEVEQSVAQELREERELELGLSREEENRLQVD